ncbi:MAG: SRPBCC family protein [Acidimicrobiia bacterium]|nr:SRPBCC family protein [Acidimicrobiia bacterium]
MIQLKETITVSAPIEAAFDYTAEFANTQDWDPGVVRAKKASSAPAKVGTAFDLVTTFKGRESEMTYTITTLDKPHRLVLAGEGDILSAVDSLEFSETATGTEIRYTADLTFKGLAKIGTLFVRKDLDQLGSDAVNGLKTALDSKN